MPTVPTVAILGGTGPLGRGLALRLARAGHPVVVGSRDAGRASAVAADLDVGTGPTPSGAASADACAAADVVVVAVPYDGLDGVLAGVRDACAGKVVVSCVNAIAFDGRGPRPVPVPAGSAAQACQAALPEARVVNAFNNVSAKHLGDPAVELSEDVLVCGDDEDAVTAALALVDAIPGLRGVAVGPLRLAGTVEAMTALILAINRRVRRSVGVRVAGLPEGA